MPSWSGQTWIGSRCFLTNSSISSRRIDLSKQWKRRWRWHALVFLSSRWPYHFNDHFPNICVLGEWSFAFYVKDWTSIIWTACRIILSTRAFFSIAVQFCVDYLSKLRIDFDNDCLISVLDSRLRKGAKWTPLWVLLALMGQRLRAKWRVVWIWFNPTGFATKIRTNCKGK